MQERVGRRQKVEDRKAMEQARIQELQEWEDKLVGPEVKDQMKTMWEVSGKNKIVSVNEKEKLVDTRV